MGFIKSLSASWMLTRNGNGPDMFCISGRKGSLEIKDYSVYVRTMDFNQPRPTMALPHVTVGRDDDNG